MDGRVIKPEEVVGDPRPGRLVVYTGDTRPSPATVEAARGADILIHEATFLDDEADRAHETFHSTAKGAALVAKEAEVDRLILTHVSARYSEDTGPITAEAREFFPATTVARDGMSLELGYRQDPDSQEGDAPETGKASSIGDSSPIDEAPEDG